MSEEQPTGVVAVEAGHMYWGERPFGFGSNVDGVRDLNKINTEDILDREIVLGLNIGKRLAGLLEQQDISVQRVLFQDDVPLHLRTRGRVLHGDDSGRNALFLGIPRHQVQEYGFTPLTIIEESSLLTDAENAIRALIAAGDSSETHRVSSSNKVWYKDGEKDRSISLRGYGKDPDFPSCEVLDFCAYRRKLEGNSTAVTVLPAHYRNQQERVRQLFTMLGQQPPVVVVYFDEDGRVVQSDSWNPEATSMLDAVLAEL